ncbi:MAG TPA: hypothetical protein VG253_07330 [Streptosporangiaceae bacterium]|nr:hypothetical protein [Streptosporangiaceae bacterium]
MKTYQVEVDRDGKFWRVRVPEVGRTTQARNLREVEPMARDLISLMDEIAEDSFHVRVRVQLPAEVQAELEQSIALRADAASRQAKAAQLSRQAARRLRDEGLSLRDVGQALGVSFQRAKQLVDGADQFGEKSDKLAS